MSDQFRQGVPQFEGSDRKSVTTFDLVATLELMIEFCLIISGSAFGPWLECILSIICIHVCFCIMLYRNQNGKNMCIISYQYEEYLTYCDHMFTSQQVIWSCMRR